MSITVKPVSSKAEMKTFIYLPESIHAHHKGWVPPFYNDDKRSFDPKRNLSFRYCEAVYALAYENGKPVGRVAGIINHRYNEHAGVQDARFGYIDTPERKDILEALLHFVEDWARQKGMQRVIGPMGFTEEDPEAFIIEGFEETTNLTTNQNFPLIPKYMEELGYSKEVDYFVYLIDIPHAMTGFYPKAFARVSRSKEFRLLEFNNKKELSAYILPILRLMNECFTVLYGYSPFEEDEMMQLAGRYLPGIDPRFVKAAINNDNEVIGFIVGIPNMAEGIRKARGRLFPFGFLHILKAQRNTQKLDVYLGAIKEAYRSKGVDVLMGYAMLLSANKAGIKYIDTHHELETNIAVRSEMERVGGRIYKKYRMFQKAVAAAKN